MKYTLLYHKAIEKDISEAKKWYKSRRKGLEKRFISEIKNSIIQLSENPYSFEIKYKDVRVKFTRIFPFGIHYYLNETKKTITILGLFHTSLSPETWKQRMNQ